MERLLLILFLVCAWPAQAEIYRYIDADGNVTFSNDPPAGVDAEPVPLSSPNTIKSVRPTPSRGLQTPSEPERKAKPRYSMLSIVEPTNESSIRDNAGNVTVAVDLAPGLKPTDTLHVYMDGSEIAQGNAMSVQLANIDRGTHEVYAAVKDPAGKMLIKSEPIRFTLHRVSILTRPPASAAQ